MRNTLIAAALLILVGAAATVAAQGPPPPGPGGPGMGPPPEVVIHDLLGLSDEQMQSLHGLLDTRRQAVEQLQPQIAQTEQALNEAIHAAQPDPTAIGTLVLQLEALRAQVSAANDAFTQGFLALLTDPQRARLDQVRATEEALRIAAALHQLGL